MDNSYSDSNSIEEKEEYLFSSISKSNSEEEKEENGDILLVCPGCGSSFYSINDDRSFLYCGDECDVSQDEINMTNIYY